MLVLLLQSAPLPVHCHQYQTRSKHWRYLEEWYNIAKSTNTITTSFPASSEPLLHRHGMSTEVTDYHNSVSHYCYAQRQPFQRPFSRCSDQQLVIQQPLRTSVKRQVLQARFKTENKHTKFIETFQIRSNSRRDVRTWSICRNNQTTCQFIVQYVISDNPYH